MTKEETIGYWKRFLKWAKAFPDFSQPSSTCVRLLALLLSFVVTVAFYHLTNYSLKSSVYEKISYKQPFDQKWLEIPKCKGNIHPSVRHLEGSEKALKCIADDIETKADASVVWGKLSNLIELWPSRLYSKDSEICKADFKMNVESPNVGEYKRASVVSGTALDTILGVSLSKPRSWSDIILSTGLYESIPSGSLRSNSSLYMWRNLENRGSSTCDGFFKKIDESDRQINYVADSIRDSLYWPRWWLLAINGPIQFLIMLAAFWCAILIMLRAIFNKKWIANKIINNPSDIDTVETTRRFLDEEDHQLDLWLIGSLPLLGFIGTVVGMIGAMDLIGEVVAAEAGTELQTQVSLLSRQLSIAFYTTFLGLISSLILTLLQNLVFGSEKRDGALALEIARKKSKVKK